jgi:hypothetical protein
VSGTNQAEGEPRAGTGPTSANSAGSGTQTSAAGGGRPGTNPTGRQEARGSGFSNQPFGGAQAGGAATAQSQNPFAPTADELKTIESWRMGNPPQWFKSALPMVKNWLFRSEWSPGPDAYHAAEAVRWALSVMRDDEGFITAETQNQDAQKNCSADAWAGAREGLTGRLTALQSNIHNLEISRSNLVGDLRRSCIILQSGRSIPCNDIIIPLETRDSETIKAYTQARAELGRVTSSKLPPPDANERDESRRTALWRAWIQGVTAEWHQRADPQIPKADALLQQRTKALMTALEKIDTVETSGSLITLDGGGASSSGTLRSRLETLRIIDDLIRISWGWPLGHSTNRWTSVGQVVSSQIECGVGWSTGSYRGGRVYFPVMEENDRSKELRKLAEAIGPEIELLRKHAFYQADSDQRQIRAEGVRERTIALEREQNAAKARNAEAQAKRGSAEDPDGKLVDAAQEAEDKAAREIYARQCTLKRMNEIVAAAGTGKPLPSHLQGDLAAFCTAEALRAIPVRTGTAAGSGGSADARAGRRPAPSPVSQPGARGSGPQPIPAPGNQSPPASRPTAGIPQPRAPVPPPSLPQGQTAGLSEAVPLSPAPPAAAPRPQFGSRPGGSEPGTSGPPAAAAAPQYRPRGEDTDEASRPVRTAALSPEQYGGIVRETLAKVSLVPRAIVDGEPVYDRFSVARVRQLGLPVEAAVVAGAYEERVPFERLIKVLAIPRDEVGRHLDEYLKRAQGIDEARTRTALVRHYTDPTTQ